MESITSGFGLKYFGASKYQDDGSFVSTEWLVICFVALFPMRSNRISLDSDWDEWHSSGKVYNIISNAPLEKRITIEILAWFWIPLLIFRTFIISFQSPGLITAMIVAGICFWILVFPSMYAAEASKAR